MKLLQSKYAYARVGIKSPGDTAVEIIVGVAIRRASETLSMQYDAVRAGVEARLAQLRCSWWLLDDDQIAQEVEQAILAHWPDRSYFIEVGRGALNEYVQVFEP